MPAWKQVGFTRQYMLMMQTKGHILPLKCCYCGEAFDYCIKKIMRHQRGSARPLRGERGRCNVDKFAHKTCLERIYY